MDVLELEAGELADDPRVRLDLSVELGEGAADVSRHGRLKHRAEELAGRGLAVRAGDAEEPRVEEPVAELDLAPDRDASVLGLGDEERLPRHARALDQQLDAFEQG